MSPDKALTGHGRGLFGVGGGGGEKSRCKATWNEKTVESEKTLYRSFQ